METADRARTGVLIVLVAQLMLVLDATVVNVALPRIDADLGFGPASLSWVLNAYTLAFGGLLLLGGRLGDVLGRLRVFEAGLAVFVLASLLGGLAPGSDLLVAPVWQAGKSEWTTYLPEGADWIHAWSSEAYVGGREVTVPAPFGRPPVFYRAGSEFSELFAGLRHL